VSLAGRSVRTVTCPRVFASDVMTEELEYNVRRIKQRLELRVEKAEGLKVLSWVITPSRHSECGVIVAQPSRLQGDAPSATLLACAEVTRIWGMIGSRRSRELQLTHHKDLNCRSRYRTSLYVVWD
jgi:hypothetical protein